MMLLLLVEVYFSRFSERHVWVRVWLIFLCRDAKYIVSDDRDREQWSAFEGQLISKNFSKCPKDISKLLRLDTWLDGCANRSILFTNLTRNVVLVQLFLPGSRPGGTLMPYWCYMHILVPKESCVDGMMLCILHFLVCTCMYILVNSGSHLEMDGREPTK